MAKLRPRARIVRTIGDQLISGPEAALIELVKNSYDADSPYVYISISQPVAGVGRIIVKDEGHGMSAEDLVSKWLEPATNDKLERRYSPVKGRPMLGAKGVGRFASARLGRMLLLRSTKLNNEASKLETSEIVLDWKQFEDATYLDQVDIDITSGPAEDGAVPGVFMEIEGLRDQWTRKQLELLVRELRRLTSPILSYDDEFRVLLDLSGFVQETHGFNGQDLVAGVSLGEEEDGDPLEIRPFSIDKIYHYMVSGDFDEAGAFVGKFVNQRGDNIPQEITIPASPLLSDESPCGRFSLRLNIYDRESDAVLELFDKLDLGGIGRRDAKKILDENIGIGIYRTGFRIRPYGDAETDWLELERLRVQNPSRKLGLNQVWGMVDIQGERESGLIERSSREGLEHNGSFSRIKRLVASLLSHVEAIRQDFRESAGMSRKASTDTENVKNKASLSATARAVSALPPQYRQKIERAIEKDSLELKTSIAELETYQQALASHSTLGLVMAQVLHDGRRFLSDITTRSSRLSKGALRLMEESEFGAHYRETFPANAASIHGSSMQLSKIFKSLDPISGKRRGRPSNVDVQSVIEKCLALFSDALEDGGVIVSRELNVQPVAVGYESDLMAALINIIDNAVHWLCSAPSDRKEIIFTLIESGQYVKISVSNTGPLIADRYFDRLFTPSFTLKTEGSGIGLAIAREAMRASKGDVAFDKENDLTTFVIEMRRAQ
ncbi:sensor histidine kinase [Pseudomonas sp. B11D7D]|nr:sensor histidine kinase [Pseudomonas sp. B11D7D]QNH04279.1 sensor histidine kinase [Pseudomonas sp. B11D7D]